MKIFYSPKCLEYSQPGHPESPERVQATHAYLGEKGYGFTEPRLCTEDEILLAHTPELLESVKKGSFFDFDTPGFPGIFDMARRSAGSALDAADHCAHNNENAFSLMRPPGHHAARQNLGGFCYFNSITIASIKAKEKYEKIAVIDFDCHHGNGTEDILFGREGFLYLSLHQSPLFPGTGQKSRDNCINYPLPASTSPKEYLTAFAEGLKDVANFGPDLLAVSAGFDSYRLDPITNLNLDLDTYREIGAMISTLKRPSFSVLEGGYSRDLPECVYQYISGLEG